MTEKVAKSFLNKYIKKISSQILNYFFGVQTIKLKYGKEAWIFHLEFKLCQKWTKKMSKKGKSKSEWPKKSRLLQPF